MHIYLLFTRLAHYRAHTPYHLPVPSTYTSYHCPTSTEPHSKIFALHLGVCLRGTIYRKTAEALQSFEYSNLTRLLKILFVLAITALHCLSAASTSLQKQLSIGERKNYGNADLLQKQILCQLILLHQALSIVPRRYTYHITLIIPSNQIKNAPHQ